MSASQKEIRKEQYEVKVTRRREAEEKAQKEARAYRIKAILVVALVVIVAAVVIVFNSGILYRLPAAQVGGTTYSAAEMNYFYSTAYSSFYSQYSDYISYFFDTDTDLDEQVYDEETGETWRDYFLEQAETSAQWVTMFSDEAEAAGRELSEDGAAAVESNLSYFSSYADVYGVSLNRYLQLQFGKGVNEKMIRTLLTKSQLASEYYNEVYDGFTYTQEETETYYTANASDLNYYSYYYYFLGGSADEENGITEEEAMAAAKEAADALAAQCTDVETYVNVVTEDSGSAPYYTTQTGANILTYGDNYPAWVLDSGRVQGDVAVIEETGGYYLLCFDTVEDNHYATKDIYYVYMEAGTDEDGNYVEEAIENTRLVAEAMMTDEWDGTVENLAELASSYSDDTTYTDGHVEHCAKGTVNSSFDQYLFGDAALADGEYVVFTVDSGVYVIYVVGDSALYSDVLAEDAMRAEDYEAWEEAKLANYDVVSQSAEKMVG